MDFIIRKVVKEVLDEVDHELELMKRLNETAIVQADYRKKKARVIVSNRYKGWDLEIIYRDLKD